MFRSILCCFPSEAGENRLLDELKQYTDVLAQIQNTELSPDRDTFISELAKVALVRNKTHITWDEFLLADGRWYGHGSWGDLFLVPVEDILARENITPLELRSDLMCETWMLHQ